MNFLSSIKSRNKENETSCMRAEALPPGYTSSLSPISSYNCNGNYSVYTFGMAHYGRLGDGQQSDDKPSPEKMQCLAGANIRSVHIESAHTLILLESGDVLSFGKCHFGQLGLGHEWMEAFCPQHVPFKVRISTLATGTHHSLAVSDRGQAFAWGCGFNGCLGHGDETMRSSPTLIDALNGLHCVSVAGGEYHSLAVVMQEEAGGGGHVAYSWGKGHQGQLGHGTYDSESLPRHIEALPCMSSCKLMAAGNLSGVLSFTGDKAARASSSSDGVILSWGSNSCGQLGHSADKPRIVVSPSIREQISNGMVKDARGIGVNLPEVVVHPHTPFEKMGDDSISFWTDFASGGQHSLAVDNRGNLYAWGYMLAFGSSVVSGECLCFPTKIDVDGSSGGENDEDELTTIARVACGSRHTLAFTMNGNCLVAGSNSSGQLGLGRENLGINSSSFLPLSFENLDGGRVLCGDGGTNSTILLVSHQ
mmetsp:Transcript_9193/g.15482  ORF Transcript_9193/g.15482 Transcript_9193/m.15482 type:complete len:477 (-) Transcript_9193:205-1635(-)